MTRGLFITCFFAISCAFASDIREFDLKTTERLGNELTRVSQSPEKGATTPAKKKAKETAMAALRGKLFNIHYDYVVLDDPSGNGFVVYALGSTRKSGQVVLGGHVRVSVSANGAVVKRVDPLSRTLLIEDEKHTGLPKGTHLVGSYYNQIVSNRPVETLIYTSNLSRRSILVQTPDGKIWQVVNGKMSIDKSKPGSETMGGAARKAFQKYGR
ncbi:MAG: hypothetical protein ACJ74Y_18475 [Bryobacteraceae bacterium]